LAESIVPLYSLLSFHLCC